MEFNNYKKQLQFLVGVCPVIIFTLKEDQWHDKKGAQYKEKKHNKIWKQFETDFIEGKKFGKDGIYETIELPSRPEVNLESSEILNAPKFAVVYNSSIRALNNLAVNVIDRLKFNVFFVDEEGRLVDFNTIKGLSEVYPCDYEQTDFDTVISEYQEVSKALIKLQKEQDEILEDIKKQEEEKEHHQELMVSESSQEDDIRHSREEEGKQPEERLESIISENKGQLEHLDEEGADGLADSDYEDDDITPEGYLKQLLGEEIQRLIPEKHVSENTKYIDVEENADPSVRSLFNLYRDKIWNESIDVNEEIDAKTEAYRRDLENELLPLIFDELEDLLEETDVDSTENQYGTAKEKFLKDYELKKQTVGEDIDNYRLSKKQELNYNREQHLQKVIAKETEEFNSHHIPIMEQEVLDYSNKSTQALKRAKELGLDEILDQANQAFQIGLDKIVPNVLAKKQSGINKAVKGYNTEIDTKIGAYEVSRENHLADLRKEANENIKLSNDYTRRTDKEVEALVQAKMPELGVLKKELELAKKNNIADREMATRYKGEYEDILNKYNEASQEKEELEQQLAESEEKFTADKGQKRKRFILVGSISVLAAAIISAGMVFSSLNNSNNSQKTKALQDKVARLEKEANAKYRVGEYIPVDTGGGHVAYGKITKIEGKKVFVEVTGQDGSVKSYNFNQE